VLKADDRILKLKYLKMSYDTTFEYHFSGCNCIDCRTTNPIPQNWKKRKLHRIEQKKKHHAGCTCTGCMVTEIFETDDLYCYRQMPEQQGNALPGIREIELEFNYVFPTASFSRVPNPVRQFFGITINQILRRKPTHWKIRPSITGRGWVILDEQGNERIRFMRPNPRLKGTNQFRRHNQIGYWIIRDGKGNYLDGDGNIVAPNISPGKMTDNQLSRIHVPFSGIQKEISTDFSNNQI
jgi:hypothetical protein